MAVGLAAGGWVVVALAATPADSALTGVVADSSAGAAPGAIGRGGMPADTVGRGLQLVRRARAPGDTMRVRARVRRGRFDTPRWVMLRSLALPGWGQLHNGSWLKAVALGGGEIWLLGRMVEDDRRIRQLRDEAERALAEGDNERYNTAVDAYNGRLDQFVSRQWLLGGLLVYALTDAYVDAHFRDFKVEFEYDPALRDGRRPGGQTRLSLRWAF